MPRRSKVEALPAPVKAWLDQALVENNFSQYERLAAELGKRGYSIGKSAVGAYGQKLERRLAAVRASTEAAKLIQAQAGDDRDARSEALTALVQTELFEAILQLQEADDPEADAGEREWFAFSHFECFLSCLVASVFHARMASLRSSWRVRMRMP